MARELNVALLIRFSNKFKPTILSHFKLLLPNCPKKKNCSVKFFLFYDCYYVNYFGRLNFEEEFREHTRRFKFITHPH